MDTFENNEMAPEEKPEAAHQPESSEYHGAGTGRREETYGNPSYTAYHMPQQPGGYQPPYYQPPYYQPYYQSAPAQQPETKKKGRKVLKGILAVVLALVILAGSCTATAYLTSRYWMDQNSNRLQNYVDQQVQNAVDSIQLPTVPGDTTNVIVTVDGLSASQIYEKNIGSVVAVSCTMPSGGSAGSGFIISQDGYIVTNYHVVEGATAVKVTLANGTRYSCEIKGFDATNDIAVLKADAEGLTPVTIGKSSEVKVGDPVVAIGNALGELSFSLTAGNVSGINREITTEGTMINMLQTDAAINSGNSGGPLFNAKGEVIGITTAKYSGTTSSGASIEGISFAIPTDDVVGMIDDLVDYGYVTGAYLGVSVSDVDPTAQMYGVPAGAYVHEVTRGYCAAKAGLQAGDIIIALGEHQVSSLNTLSRALRNFKGGDTSTITVWRGGKQIELTITFDEKPRG